MKRGNKHLYKPYLKAIGPFSTGRINVYVKENKLNL